MIIESKPSRQAQASNALRLSGGPILPVQRLDKPQPPAVVIQTKNPTYLFSWFGEVVLWATRHPVDFSFDARARASLRCK